MSTTPDTHDTHDMHETAESHTDDTIAAIATPPGVGGIGIVRLSGPLAFSLGLRIFRPAHPLAEGAVPPSHQLLYGHVVDPASDAVIDEALIAFMRAPHTYTREDVVEISAHGGPLVLRRILELALAAGGRAANPGEMTLRAFLNGRVDLAQAEAVMALINAETDAGHRLALRQLQGELSAQVASARRLAMEALVRIEASIDFPEEEVPPPDPAELAALLAEAQERIERLLAGADRGRVLREGLRVALVGRPNVGKSSLLNALLRTERAIVTPVAGTTRDTVEEKALIGGLAVQLVDTAGLATSDDPVERIGVERSRAAARAADMLLLVLDGSEPLTPADSEVAADLRELTQADETGATRPAIIILNKADLSRRLDDEEALALWPGASVIATSTITGEGLAPLEEQIAALALGGTAQAGDALVSSARHKDALRRGLEHTQAARATLADGLPLDFVAIDLRATLDALGEITGETATADLLDRIFAEFCIGK
jgi:tRNA modification GTPase